MAERNYGIQHKNLGKLVPWGEKLGAWSKRPVTSLLHNAMLWHLKEERLHDLRPKAEVFSDYVANQMKEINVTTSAPNST